jgi:cobalt-zinc-cadmium resistance protein CzcA
MFTIALIVWGSVSLWQLPVDATPDITNNQVQVVALAPTLGTQEIEQQITSPVEMALANIPRTVERRSLSRNGMAVFTIVFEDNVDIYWARTQVSERIAEAGENIPSDIANISLSPVTTGLGEIYHYVIHPAKGYEDKYSDMDLRTIQDWIVKRRLEGTKGVAEVSGWGGHVKQYEIALNPEKMSSLHVTLPEIYKALENNNENTGGSYMEHGAGYNVIRGLGLVKTLDDIRRIAIRDNGGVPLLIGDVATVGYGSAIRYGAVTRNGEGESVAGITLMLKGENFSEVIANVKEKMDDIQKSLPEGVVIEPFIDRTELVSRTTRTIATNLIEGGLIVIFVLVLLLGHWRAGLLVASVIPLSMLFAFGMMNLFGVSGNLMSLGAIDFGLIVDGSVIMVEAIVSALVGNRAITSGGSYGKSSFSGKFGNIVCTYGADIKPLNYFRNKFDNAVYNAASNIRTSAAFGEIIILIVYIPIFALTGIEGKMFRPMAQTVAFAILGAFILSLTYIPMMSSIVLRKNIDNRFAISDKIIAFVKSVYEPCLRYILRKKRVVILTSFALFAAAIFGFTQLGGEFLPTLEEGDLTAEISMAQGTSLSQVIETFGKAEKILKENFPEVRQAVTRIGSAEIPTDPMPVERGDMMIAMKPKKQWVTAHSRAEMSEKMEEALSVLPGVNVEITQPMQMRFNELITGIRQDVAIKIYGADLDILSEEANKVAALIKNVKGVGEPFVETVVGMLQIQVIYDRDKLVRYGLSVKEVNDILSAAFAGKKAGVVYEGEKRFDLVVRLEKDLRNDIESIRNLYIPLPNGSVHRSGDEIPLHQIATVEYRSAPAQISRDNASRRIYVGFNVRGRDVQSTVNEIEKILDAKLKLPAGYYYTYGGQFQNLLQAEKRLAIAVPVALLLIFFLLYITFHNMRNALLVFSAVPLSAIGGIVALLLRGMPFSISAGVGFIALFGVAVLNGIVLVAQFEKLKNNNDFCDNDSRTLNSEDELNARVIKGTLLRIRPVLMTALVASLGFLPMALSTGDGSEVQKPLASVVIGGLVTSTLLTLFVLPVLYILMQRKIKWRLGSLMCFLLCGVFTVAGAQTKSLQECIDIALRQSPQIVLAQIEASKSRAEAAAVFNPEKTSFSYSQDPLRPDWIDRKISISQTFAFPSVYVAQGIAYKKEKQASEITVEIARKEIVKEVSARYYAIMQKAEDAALLEKVNLLYDSIVAISQIRYGSGEISLSENLFSKAKKQDALLKMQTAQKELREEIFALKQILGTDSSIIPDKNEFYKIVDMRRSNDSESIFSNLWDKKFEAAKARAAVEKNKLLPDIFGTYSYTDARMSGFEAGISIPIFPGEQISRIKNANLTKKQIAIERSVALQQIQNALVKAETELLQAEQQCRYYMESGLNDIDTLQNAAFLSFRKGDTSPVDYIRSLQEILLLRQIAFNAILRYHNARIQIEYLK